MLEAINTEYSKRKLMPENKYKDSLDMIIIYSYELAEDIIESFNKGMRIDTLNCGNLQISPTTSTINLQ